MNAFPHGYYSRLIEVIETTRARGKGVVSDPVRMVRQYWSKDGELLAERDAWGPQEPSRLDAVGTPSVREHDVVDIQKSESPSA